MKKILDYLEQLDLSDVEAKLYLSLLNTGPTSVRDLAATIDIKRTTTYLYIDQLIEKGLIMKVVKGSQKLVAANDPKDSLEFLVKRKLQTAITVENEFPDMLRALTTSLPQVKEIGDAEIKYYKGKNGIQKIYDEALLSQELRVYANLSELESLFKINGLILEYQIYEKALLKNKELKIYEIVADEPRSIDKFNLNQTVQTKRYYHKYIPASVGLTSPGILMYDNKVVTINGKENFNIVVLHNIDYYTNSIRLFDFIWKMLPEPEIKV